ncbi:MAG: aminoacetone oxidase family FAD-binding enzyme [Rhodobacteraceae bacterium]|nr:aminoacetone oxidase family FAD-binding enzyme [Paracoccaceae bacterium]
MRFRTVIIGAGAAGMMCAAHAGPGTLVIDHARSPGEKIRISGGGRCNFTNLGTAPENFLSDNPHFCKSALARYTPGDFIALVDRHAIAWHEKTRGQLFCDGRATRIVAMLRHEMERAGATLWLQTAVAGLSGGADGFALAVDREGARIELTCSNLVLATGGRSIPKMGATGFAHDAARRFGLNVTQTRPALVPFTFPEGRFAALAGVSLPVRLKNARASFDEALLFTHRGLSGPAVLQLSSYWREGETIVADLIPGIALLDSLRKRRRRQGGRDLKTELARHLPARLVEHLAGEIPMSGRLADQSDAGLRTLCERLANWRLTPSGSEGWRTAEVTLGGIDTAGLSSRTMEAGSVPGLFVIGEAVDVTGWLGGYNFQWAWASGVAAGSAIAARR